ncbi:MAG: exonuclease SbcCD subunit D C-terminal domain-containing protein [Verrucomicrobiales bacterium]|nr:exonuclease SbcCD subunit D C-terminal domain-containing protein [Verrucomicrobiales bacterium]
MMKLLHTADWHLGARLVERERLPEQVRFLDWLLEVMAEEKVEVLLVAGDVFDVANPSRQALALYYDFLHRLVDLKTVRAVITAGNHDSASQLNGPRDLLGRLGVTVVGEALEPEAAWVDLGEVRVAAVPFLRERDLRRSGAGESVVEVEAQVRAAIAEHYARVLAAGRALPGKKPLLAMGHLTALGAVTSEGERDIHVGNLGAVGAEVFAGYDYVALGHLHRAQVVGGMETVRYSGSPLALSFSEAGDGKSVTLVEVEAGGAMRVNPLAVPVWRPLQRLSTELDGLEQVLRGAMAEAWVELTVRLDQPEPGLDAWVREVAAGLGGGREVLKVVADLPLAQREPWEQAGPTLEEWDPPRVFAERMIAAGVAETAREELMATFLELLAEREARETL